MKTKVSMTVRKGRKVLGTSIIDYAKAIDQIINITGGAYEAIRCKDLLVEGKSYKLTNPNNGLRATYTPLYGNDYSLSD